MKTINTVIAAVVLSTASFATFAATEVNQSQGRPIGSVSASAISLGDLQANLSSAADASGAKSFRIISAMDSSNHIRGVAEIYN
ncbi:MULTISPECIES: DUF1471 domain-containing protein [Lonsdalea]|uniref:Multiple stress resistance protein BhsA n=2 Tax=Lonsdalea TaxID=1082702 RepID=A0ACD1JBN5_9GAMM|nr:MULTISPECIES: DUF1471 domain-containing protein [Lonsdalea]OSM98493.1 multiple stress resistance protein BhsA [Lonsdalea populi]OSN01638.1 multiple stress resistance protein BhsA [Lonsdalea populi]QPQ24730.1 DUF1471 domain-containing protein [Lonsdalea populi]RAT13058.1 multiple stress resistance protein BhsA [Lonsdalea quercina]RAT14442.1 multiple stress resistance protein BhsA [Lonsdalea quercina]